jgi:hypothetical protein
MTFDLEGLLPLISNNDETFDTEHRDLRCRNTTRTSTRKVQNVDVEDFDHDIEGDRAVTFKFESVRYRRSRSESDTRYRGGKDPDSDVAAGTVGRALPACARQKNQGPARFP